MRVEVDRKEGYEEVEIIEFVGKRRRIRKEKVRVITSLYVDIDALRKQIEEAIKAGKSVDSALEELGWKEHAEKIKKLLQSKADSKNEKP